MSAWLLALFLTTAPAGSVHLAATSMTVADVSPEKGRFFEQQLAQQLSLQPGVRVTTADDINRILGLERQKQLLGCDETACTELADAPGADALVSSSVAKVGSTWALNVRVTSARAVRTLSVFSGQASTEDGALGLLATAAQQVARDLGAGPPPPSARSLAWAPAVIGGVLGVAGGVLFWLSTQQAARFTPPTTFVDVTELRSAGATGSLELTLGLAGFVSGGAALLAATAMYVFGAPPAVQVGVSVGPGHAGAMLGVRW
jgi:hypothetical protein